MKKERKSVTHDRKTLKETAVLADLQEGTVHEYSS